MAIKMKTPLFKSKFKSGDSIVVISGSNKGRKGQIEKILSDGRCVVSGITVKKAVKPNPHRNIEGGLMDKALPMNPSNLAIYNSETQKADRIAFKFLEDGTKVRVYAKTKEMINV